MNNLFLYIISVFFLFFQSPRKVYICSNGDISTLIFDEKLKNVNLNIDHSLINDEKLQEGVKLYLASFFVFNKAHLESYFNNEFKMTIDKFGRKHKKIISEVIYYLEHEDHGNLPLIYNHEAYKLFDIRELKPDIEEVKMKLQNSGMLLIDIDADVKTKDLRSIKLK